MYVKSNLLKLTAMYQLQLVIPEPCHEDWEKMTPNEQGKFCNSCAKSVIDFSTMTDTQLINYFQQLKEEHICGNFSPDQIERTIVSQPLSRKKIFNYWQYLLAFFLMLTKGQQSRAQSGIRAKPVETNQAPVTKNTVATEMLELKVTDDSNAPIVGVSIRFQSSFQTVCTTDAIGNFKIEKKQGDENLVLSAVGYQTKTVAIKNIDAAAIKLAKDIQLLEQIVIVSSAKSRGKGLPMWGLRSVPTTKDSIMNFIAPAASIYPNPVTRGAMLTISVKLKEVATYRVHFIDASGKLLLSQNYTAVNKKPVQQMMIPASWSRGVYFAVITTTDGKQIGKQKIIVL
jgi:hypothetical protein